MQLIQKLASGLGDIGTTIYKHYPAACGDLQEWYNASSYHSDHSGKEWTSYNSAEQQLILLEYLKEKLSADDFQLVIDYGNQLNTTVPSIGPYQVVCGFTILEENLTTSL